MNFCYNCKKRIKEDEAHSILYDKDGDSFKEKGKMCYICGMNEGIFDYIQKKELNSRILREATSCQIYKEYNYDRIRPECAEFFRNNEDILLGGVMKDYEEIQAKATEVGKKYWHPILQEYYKESPSRGHSIKKKHYHAMMWGSAGRVLITIRDSQPQGKGKFGGAWVSLIYDEDSKTADGGIQGLCATKEEALGLLDAVLTDLPKMEPDKEVSII